MERAQESPTFIERLVDFVFDCRLQSIPGDVRESASLLLLDALGVAVANSGKPFTRKLARTVEQTIAEGSCTAIGFRRKFVPEGAAAINSTAIHGNDFDATHIVSIIHPCAVVVPTALAVAEEVGTSGSELLSAMVAGFEVLIRMGLATRGALHRGGFQATALCAPIALAMVAGRLYGLSREEAVSAAGLSASIGAGLRAFSDDGTWGKRIITGWSCRAALMATALAREGYPGSCDALEKQPFGFYRAFLPGGGYELSELTKGLGQEWETRDVDLKRYPCSHGHHAFVNAARRARAALKLQPENIGSVAVHVSAEAAKWWFEPKDRKYELPDIYGARFSMPYTIALALVFGNVTDEYLESRRFLDDSRVRALVQGISPKIDNTLSNANPNHLPGTLSVTTRDGRVEVFDGSATVAGDTFKDAVLEKFALNSSAVLGTRKANDLIARTTAIEKQVDIKQMMSLLRG